MEEESPLSKKRTQHKKQIRKEQLESVFKSKRAELIEAELKDLQNFTAGKKVSQKQKEILNKQNFQKVFSKHELDTLEVDFQLFKKKANLILLLNVKLFLKLINLCYIFVKQKQIRSLGSQIVIYLILSNSKKLFINQEWIKLRLIIFLKCILAVKLRQDKKNGIQLGNKMKIYSFQTEKQIIYHVKTHSNGLFFVKSSAAEILNPLELIIYKILEKIGIGCESHFFYRDIRNFCIATKDAGADYPYFSYEQIRKNLKGFEFVKSQNFSNGIFCLDLLSRILRLTDLQTNPGNFGFVQSPDGWHVRVIDFRLPLANQNNEITQAQFRGFLKGNTQVSYKDEIISNLFEKEKDKLENIAKKIFLNQFKQFLKDVEDCGKYVLQVIYKQSKNIKWNYQQKIMKK